MMRLAIRSRLLLGARRDVRMLAIECAIGDVYYRSLVIADRLRSSTNQCPPHAVRIWASKQFLPSPELYDVKNTCKVVVLCQYR